MEPKVEKEASKNQGSKAAPQTAKPPSTNQQQASGDTDPLKLSRSWIDREHTLNNRFQDELWWKAKPHSGNTLERWRVQSMTDGPYQNIESIMTKTKTDQPQLPNVTLPKHARTVSEAAGTSGSK
ncbi:hypothetical protein F5Y00DRAFT_256591 [Daldinia vernicosa]|uniref:uncharacterized protein n=1 Tax=Daldinia vernicosa TaxID=114800 RepID=UPI002008A001|nr:uncharacterized protein F5Y00DRAFT_256591 [Daldinia vernicosa]KAI0854091.1 hypothetical protein F5Y00DRAFT_256591 [Daldinia vernicosa]